MAATSVAGSGIVLEPLTEENYENWSTLVKNYLLGKDLWDFVTSSVSGDTSKFRKKNAKALHIIQLACGSETLIHIREVKTAREAWDKLRVLHSSQADPDIQQGMVDDNLLHYKPLHEYVLRGEWNDAESFIQDDRTAIFSTSFLGRTILHLAVIAGHKNIVEELVMLGKDTLVKMQDNNGYTALALAAELTENIIMAKYMVEMTGSEIDLLSMKTKDGEIPVLLAAAKGHSQMTRYLYSRTKLEELVDQNFRNGVLLLTRCITAKIFDVALNVLKRIPELPLAHESQDLQPLYALARMPSASRRDIRFIFLECILSIFFGIEMQGGILQEDDTTTVIVPQVSQEEGQHKCSFPGRIGEWVLTSETVQLIGQVFKVTLQLSLLINLSEIRKIYHQGMTRLQVLEMINCLYQRVRGLDESQLRRASAYDAMLQAAKFGNVEFIDQMSKANLNLLWAVDDTEKDIFSHAIMNRRKQFFQLLDVAKVNGVKEIVTSRTDVLGNTLLHLAAYLGPSSDLDSRSGPVVQMQREIQWFKAVERVVHPKCKEAKNADGKKPREIFTESHKELVKAGEKWAKEIAVHFTLVGTLIITVVFAAAFTVPGGNNQESGEPLFLHNKIFTVFMISDAISLFSSSTSVMLFNDILTSRFAEMDFQEILPWKLFWGIVALFVSVISMIVAFCASLAMILKGHRGIIILAITLGCIPIAALGRSQLLLFLEIFFSTIRSIYLERTSLVVRSLRTRLGS